MEFSSSIAKELKSTICSDPDPSWKLENWPRKNVNELLLPLTCHVKADGAGHQRLKAALSTIILRGPPSQPSAPHNPLTPLYGTS